MSRTHVMTRVVTGALIATSLVAGGAGLAGCAGDVAGGEDVGSGSGSGGGGNFPSPCQISLMTSPAAPVAGPSTMIQATAQVFDASGVVHYQWAVQHDGADVAIQPGATENQILFAAPAAGIYDLALTLPGAPGSCASAVQSVNVEAPGAHSKIYRMRVVPPRGVLSPPFETVAQIKGGAARDLGFTVFTPGALSPIHVRDAGGTGVPAYVRLAPAGTPDAIVELFAGDDGIARPTFGPGLYDVLVVPSAAALAPRQVHGWFDTDLVVDAGQTVAGTVLDPAGNALAGAQVQLAIAGVPSSLATTGADGSFAVHAVLVAGASVTVDVAPPAASGLPRMTATSAGFALGGAVQVRYAGNVSRKDLAGLALRRHGAPIAGARVTVVGSAAAIGAVGTVTAGAAASGSGALAIVTASNAAGVLPSVLVPADPLQLVIEVGDGDRAVVALDTRSALPASLEVPDPQPVTTAVRGPGGLLDGAELELVPAGALALAAVPPLHVIADASGAIATQLAAGGHYDLRFRDPAGRAAPTALLDRTTATIATSIVLDPAIEIRGTVMDSGIRPLAGAAVQLLCSDCTGIDRARPIAEGMTDAAGRFSLAVPDPGTDGTL